MGIMSQANGSSGNSHIAASFPASSPSKAASALNPTSGPASDPIPAPVNDAAATAPATGDTASPPAATEAEAQRLLTEGQATLRAGDATKAIDLLSAAVAQFVALHGDFALECAPVYTAYGRAMLQAHVKSTSVLGEILQERQKNGQQAIGLAQGGLVGEADASVSSDEEDEAKQPEPQPQQTEGGADADADAASDSDSECEQDLHAASWEVLDLARSIYDKALARDDKARLNNTQSRMTDTQRRSTALQSAALYETLADHCTEGDEFAQAYAAYECALALYTPLLATQPSPNEPSLLRKLAALHSDMSVACLYDGRAHHALLHYHESQKYMQQRLAQLSQRSPVSQDDQQEIDECKDILEELAERVTGIVDRIKEAAAEEARQKAEQDKPISVPKMDFGLQSSSSTTATSTSSAATTASAPVTMLGVKRKNLPAAAAPVAALPATTTTVSSSSVNVDPRKKQKQ